MKMGTRNERFNHKRMRRAGALVLALMLLTLPIAATSVFALTGEDESQYILPSGMWAAGVRERGEANSQLALAEDSPRYVLPSGVDPSGPVHGSSLSCLGLSEPDALC